VKAKPPGSFGPVDINTHSTAQHFVCRARDWRSMGGPAERLRALEVASPQQTRIDKQQQNVGFEGSADLGVGNSNQRAPSAATHHPRLRFICSLPRHARLLPSSHMLTNLQSKMLRVIAGMFCSVLPSEGCESAGSWWTDARTIVGAWFFGSLR